jgi:DNA-binding CsgD family transcriptional regulator
VLTYEDDVATKPRDPPGASVAPGEGETANIPTEVSPSMWPSASFARAAESARTVDPRLKIDDGLGRSSTRLAGLPHRTRQLLVLAALDGSGDLRVLQAATSGRAIDDLEPAELARLVVVDISAQSVVFCHSEIDAEVLDNSTSHERTECHRLLAQLSVDQPVKRAWHLAEATIGPDESVAALLDATAQIALHDGDPVGAVSILLRAAQLGSRGSNRGRRLSAAAYIGTTGVGRLGDMSALLDDARRSGGGRNDSLVAAVTSAYLLVNEDGDVDTAHRLVVEALKTCVLQTGDFDEVIGAAISVLGYLGHLGARAELWLPLDESLVERLDPSTRKELTLLRSIAADPARATNGSLEELDLAVAGLSDEFDTARVLRVSRTAALVDRLAGCREALWRVVRESQQRNAGGQSIVALASLSLDRLGCGAWDRANDLAEQGLRLGEANGNSLYAWVFRYYRGIVAAARGETEVVDRMVQDIAQWGMPRRADAANTAIQCVQGLASLSRGEFEAAYGHLAAVSAPGVIASHVPQALWATMDLVETATRTDRMAEAEAHVAAMLEARIAEISPRMALLVGGSLAIVSPIDIAGEAFREALRIPGIDSWPFEQARVLLLYGEHLRRAREITEARLVLAKALEHFQHLGAQPWVTRASNELRASGVSLSQPEASTSIFTPQEREIALMAASGMTNKEIGQRLYLSHRTVGSHLYRVFPKLGITSRMELRDAIAILTPAVSE